MTNEISTIQNEEWFEQLCDEVRAIIVERGFNSRMEIVEGKWEIGRRIAEDENYKKHAKGSGAVVGQIAAGIGMSETDVYDCIKFFGLCPGGVSTGAETLGKNLSWRRVKIELLGRKDDKKGTPLVCYRIEGILEAFKNWFDNDLDKCSTLDADEAVKIFKKYLIKLRK